MQIADTAGNFLRLLLNPTPHNVFYIGDAGKKGHVNFAMQCDILQCISMKCNLLQVCRLDPIYIAIYLGLPSECDI